METVGGVRDVCAFYHVLSYDRTLRTAHPKSPCRARPPDQPPKQFCGKRLGDAARSIVYDDADAEDWRSPSFKSFADLHTVGDGKAQRQIPG